MENDFDIEGFIHKTPADLNPKAGQILIAAPMMNDPNFRRSVVLILDSTHGEHMGLVLNRETTAGADVFLDGWDGTERIHLFNGGPVELDRLFLLHRLGSIIDGSNEILPGLYIGGDADQLRDYIASGAGTEGLLRFFFGYSGWGEGQLTSELMQNGWAVGTDPDLAGLLSGSGDSFWRREVENLGPDFRSWLNIPIHPILN